MLPTEEGRGCCNLLLLSVSQKVRLWRPGEAGAIRRCNEEVVSGGDIKRANKPVF